jgi:hypothetical protein
MATPATRATTGIATRRVSKDLILLMFIGFASPVVGTNELVVRGKFF